MTKFSACCLHDELVCNIQRLVFVNKKIEFSLQEGRFPPSNFPYNVSAIYAVFTKMSLRSVNIQATY